jgi:hypothetical protein
MSPKPRYPDPLGPGREWSPEWQVAVSQSSVWRTCNICGYIVNDDGSMSERKQTDALLTHKKKHRKELIGN